MQCVLHATNRGMKIRQSSLPASGFLVFFFFFCFFLKNLLTNYKKGLDLKFSQNMKRLRFKILVVVGGTKRAEVYTWQLRVGH